MLSLWSTECGDGRVIGFVIVSVAQEWCCWTPYAKVSAMLDWLIQVEILLLGIWYMFSISSSLVCIQLYDVRFSLNVWWDFEFSLLCFCINEFATLLVWNTSCFHWKWCHNLVRAVNLELSTTWTLLINIQSPLFWRGLRVAKECFCHSVGSLSALLLIMPKWGHFAIFVVVALKNVTFSWNFIVFCSHLYDAMLLRDLSPGSIVPLAAVCPYVLSQLIYVLWFCIWVSSCFFNDLILGH